MRGRLEMTSKTDARLKFNKFVVYFALIALLAGCASFETLPGTDAQSLASQIEVGDKIKIVRNDETAVKFTVDAISDEGISGDGVFVAYSDIRDVQINRFKLLEGTSGNIAGILLFLVVIVAYTVGSLSP